MESHCSTYDDAKDFFPRLRRWYEDIKLFPTPNQVNFLFGDRFDGLEAIRSFG